MPYRILSLDGGGSWALIQAHVLRDLYGDIRGHALLKQFDMAIANSGGSLVLACLCNDMTLSEISNVFEDENSRKQVFCELNFFEKLIYKQDRFALLRGLLGIGPKYNTKKKLTGLVKVLSDKDHLFPQRQKHVVDTPLNELPALIGNESLQLLIVGFDYFRQRVSFFRSNMQSKTDLFSNKYYGLPLGHAIHASSNAPVNYFDAPAMVSPYIFQKKPTFTEPVYRNTGWYWDGAVSGFNNPVLAGVIEAITNGVNPKDCCILSIGTGTGNKVILTDIATSNDPADQAKVEANKNNELVVTDTSAVFKNDIKKMATSVLDDPPDSATFIAYAVIDPSLSNSANVVRINPCYSPEFNSGTKLYEIPRVYQSETGGLDKIKKLFDLDMDAVKSSEVDLIVELCNKFITTTEPCLPNQLIRGDISNQYLGQPTYKAAKEKWMNCK